MWISDKAWSTSRAPGAVACPERVRGAGRSRWAVTGPRPS